MEEERRAAAAAAERRKESVYDCPYEPKWDATVTISPNLTWEYTSTVRGRWFAYGTAQIKESGSVVLEGWFSGTPSYGPPERLIMILHRYDESLTGEFRLSQTWRVSFSRAGRPA